MAKHLTVDEQSLVDDIIKRQKLTPLKALAAVQAKRESRGEVGPTKHTIYRYLNSGTHLRGRKEKRGRSKSLSRGDVRKLMQTRRRLIKAADNATDSPQMWQSFANLQSIRVGVLAPMPA